MWQKEAALRMRYSGLAKGHVAAATADNLHSGAVQVINGSFTLVQSSRDVQVLATTRPGEQRTVTVSESLLLDLTRVFTMCFAFQTGAADDPTWQDSYIRMKLKDEVLPILLTVAPPNGGLDVETPLTVVLTFSESVQAGTGSIHFVPVNGSDGLANLTVAANDTSQVTSSCVRHCLSYLTLVCMLIVVVVMWSLCTELCPAMHR